MPSPQIKVLFDQRVIPNYRIPIFNYIGQDRCISLAVSYWKKRNIYEPPHVNSDRYYKSIEFNPLQFNISGKNWFFNFSLLKYIFFKKPHVVIGPSGLFGINPAFSFIIERICRIFVGTEFVYRTSGYLMQNRKLSHEPMGIKRLWHKIRARYAIFLTYGERAAEHLHNLGYLKERIYIDYNAMDSIQLFKTKKKLVDTEVKWKKDFMQSLGITTQKAILFAGRVYPEKRLDVLVEAFSRVVKEYNNLVLIVVGSGPGIKEVQRCSDSLNIPVYFAGSIYDENELAKYFIVSDIVVFPGYATLSIYFALCFSKAIITSDYGNEAEYVQQGINGLKYKYGDTKDLEDKIKLLLNNPELCCRYGKSGENFVKEKIGVQHMIATILKVIHAVADK